MYQSDLFGAVVKKLVYRYNDGSLELTRAAEVSCEIFQAARQGCGIRLGECIQRHATMHLQGADGGHNDNGFRLEARLAALDVNESVPTEIKGETGFRHRIIGVGQGHARGQNGIATMSDVRKRSAMEEGGHTFDGLYEIGLQSIA